MHGQTQGERLRVFLAIAAPLSRAQVRRTLLQEARIDIVGEATTGISVAQHAPGADPQFILCDEYVLADPDLGQFARGRSRLVTYKFVLMASNPERVTYRGDAPVALSLRFDLSGAEIIERLAPLLVPPVQPPPPPVIGMDDHFLVVGRGLGGNLLGRDKVVNHNPHRTQELTPTQLRHMPQVTLPLDSRGRRQPSEAHAVLVDRLALIQTRMAQHRDGVTGLASPMALDSALRALQDISCPTAVIVCQLWNVRSASTIQRVSLDEDALRRAGATLRATLRDEDLACRLEGTCFAMVMPGLEERHASRPVERIRTALRQRQIDHNGTRLATAFGVGYWQPPMRTAQPLEQAWQAMVAESNQFAS